MFCVLVSAVYFSEPVAPKGPPPNHLQKEARQLQITPIQQLQLIQQRCADGEQNFNETDVDCGGPFVKINGVMAGCQRCLSNKICLVDGDCMDMKGFLCEDGKCILKGDSKKAAQVYPSGGVFHTSTLVQLKSPWHDTNPEHRIYYTVTSLSDPHPIYKDLPHPYREPTLPSLTSKWVRSGDQIILSESCTLLASVYKPPFLTEIHRTEPHDVVSIAPAIRTFDISSGRYGYGYFVPSYNRALGYSGKFTRLDLGAPGPPPDFANFQTRLGQGAYEGQLRVLDLTHIDDELRGFQGGFAVEAPRANNTMANFGFLVPFFNGKFFGKLTRVDLDFFNLCADPIAHLDQGSVESIFDLESGTWMNRTRVTNIRGPVV